MIPKIIHYCWFGKNKKPHLANKCIKSWKKFFSGYQIIEWNEDNYDIQRAPLFVRQAYAAKKWAFVSDYVRFDVVYRIGGVYFDTDVEVIKSMTDLLTSNGYVGCEIDGGENSFIRLNPGLGMAFEPSNILCKEILDTFKSDVFITNDGEYNYKTIVDRTTEVFYRYGLKNIGDKQLIKGICVYPKEYFAPIDCVSGEMNSTDETRSIHWWDASWRTEKRKASILNRYLRTRVRKILGNKYIKIRNHFM